MINLLSETRRAEIRAARTNVILVLYTSIIAFAVIFLMIVLYGFYSVLQETMKSADQQVQANDVKAAVYSGTKSQVDALATKLSDSKTIMNQSVSYSSLLVKLGQAMPAGTILDSLKLSSATFAGTPVQLRVYGKNSSDAVTVRDHLQSSGLFSLVNLQSTSTTTGIDGYPVTINLTVVFTKPGAQ